MSFRKRLIQWSIWLPIMFLGYLQIHPVKLYLEQLNINLYYSRTCFFYTMFAVAWLVLPSLRKVFRNGGLFELCYHLFPIELLLFVIFAQWHFVWACILLLVVVLAFLAVFVLMTVYEVNGSYAAIGEIGMVCKRFFVLAACVVWLIPSIIAIHVYKLEDPKYVADRELWENFSSGKLPWESNREEELTEEERLLFGCFRESQWQQYSGPERITILQKLVDYEAERLGMPTVEISTETLEPSVLGQQGGYGDKIQVDLQHLNTSPVKDVVITCLHESYHAYQSYLVESIDWNAEYTKGIYFQEVRNWRENFSSYIGNGKDFEAYEAQPVEAAARAYAEEEYEFILSMVE